MTFKDLLRYRNVWVGVAMIWIVLFHFGANFYFGPLNFLREIGYGGVDICFFASGIGCFFSLSADPDAGNFMKRRFKRLLPTYLIFMIFWLAFKYVLGEFDFQMAIGNILAVQNFTGLGNYLNWYISAIFLFYLLAPYFKLIIDRANRLCSKAFVLFLLVFSVAFWGADTYIITVTRLAIFYIGMLFAQLCQTQAKIKPRHVFIAVGAFVLGVCALLFSYKYLSAQLWSQGLHWYPFILITVPLCMAISYVMSIIEKAKIAKPIAAFLSLCGKFSFEIYLLQFPLVTIVEIIVNKCHLEKYMGFSWLISIPMFVVGCFALKKMVALQEYIRTKITQRTSI